MNELFDKYRSMTKRFSVALRASLLLVGALVLGSCNPTVGLGQKVDMTGPKLTITGPDYMANVLKTFDLTGTVTDDLSVANVTVTIEGADCSWKNEKGAWLYQSAPGALWTPVTDGVWTETGKASYNWTLPVTIPGTPSGEYVIKVTSTDDLSNMESSSIGQRTLVCDTASPILTINSPVLFIGTSAAAIAKYSAYSLKNSADLDSLLNGSLEISGSQIENSLLDRIEIEITDADGNQYWTKTLSSTDDPVPNLRNFTVSTGELKRLSTGLAPTTKTALQVITRSYDMATNHEDKSNGWFCYWPESDVPWTESPADPVDPAKYSIYPGLSIQGQAFDDDGLKSVTLSLYKGTTNLSDPVGTPTVLTLTGSPKFYSWAIDCPSESGTYTIIASCVDSNDRASAQNKGFFTVEDVTIPAVYSTSPDQTTTLFGDATGNFAVAGTVDDNSGVADLRLAWINPQGANAADSQLLYLDQSYSSWKSGFAGSSKTDANGNKVWIVTLGPKSKNANGRMESAFSQALNLFSDLGISASVPLCNQTFILRAEDDSGKTRMLKVATSGDTKAPTLTIDSVTVRSSVDTTYPITSGLTLSAMTAGETVLLKGTWSDDSTNVWSDKTKRGTLTVKWGNTSLLATAAADGTWSTAPVAPPAGAVAAITASLADFGGNVGTATASFFVETDIPELLRVSSENSDGSYKAGSVVSVYLDFNKNVWFTGGSVNPAITLSNGATAVYVSGNGTSRHKYAYTVASGDTNTTLLGVTDVVENGHIWRDATAKTVSVGTQPTGVNSFSGGKKISIDTVAPTIASVSTVSAAGSYKAGGEIYLTVTFSEAVTVSDKALPRLELSSGANVYATGMNQVNDKTYVLTYKVLAGHNTAVLSVDSFDLNGATIVDAAGNPRTGTTPSAIGKAIVIDTAVPASPTITGLTDGTTYYSAHAFSVSGEAGATIQYSVDNGTTWITGATANLSVDGGYSVLARQTDTAGNTSAISPVYVIAIDTAPLLLNVSSDDADGLYTTGDTINIKLNFRKPISVISLPSSTTLTLNTTPVATAAYASGSGTTSLVFAYTIANGESVNRLNATAVAGSFEDDGGNAVTFTMPIATDSASLIKQKNFRVITGRPTIDTVSLSGTTLTITFDRDVYKGSGSLGIIQKAADVRVPAVLTASEYGANGISTWMSSYYAVDTNGAVEQPVGSGSFSPDTGSKYVLKFANNSSDAALITEFLKTSAYKVYVPVASSALVVSGPTVTVSLTGSYALPVKGAEYTVSVPAGLFKDVVETTNALDDSNSVTCGGVEPPVIRVNKVSETILNVGGNLAASISQPTTTTFKIDCETPGATLDYTRTETSIATAGVVLYAQPQPTPGANPAMPTTATTTYSGAVTIGSASDLVKGYKYAIAAKSTKGTDTAMGYEYAFRSVLVFNNDANVTVTNTDNSATLKETVWVRGGDSTSGSTMTPGFPLAWDSSDWTKDDTDYPAKVRAMTKAATGNQYYWMSWQLNTTAYVGLLAGSLPSTVADAIANGPKFWSWAKNSYVPFKEYYPVFPGESRTAVSTDSDDYNKFDTYPHGAFKFGDASDGGIYTRP